MPRSETSDWAIEFISFAAVMMMTGAFQALAGLVAILEEQFYVLTANHVFQFDVTTWGWIQLILGVVVVAAGLGVLSGHTWGRVVGSPWRC